MRKKFMKVDMFDRKRNNYAANIVSIDEIKDKMFNIIMEIKHTFFTQHDSMEK
jgi:hypothetical protein